MYSDWTSLLSSSWALGIESSEVIGLRTLKLSQGGAAAAAEFNLMISEKVDAASALNTQALCGKLGATPFGAARKILSHYREEVRANRFRLSNPKAAPGDVRKSPPADDAAAVGEALSRSLPTNQLKKRSCRLASVSSLQRPH